MNISVLYTKMVLLEQGDNTQEMLAHYTAQELSIVVLSMAVTCCHLDTTGWEFARIWLPEKEKIWKVHTVHIVKVNANNIETRSSLERDVYIYVSSWGLTLTSSENWDENFIYIYYA